MDDIENPETKTPEINTDQIRPVAVAETTSHARGRYDTAKDVGAKALAVLVGVTAAATLAATSARAAPSKTNIANTPAHINREAKPKNDPEAVTRKLFDQIRENKAETLYAFNGIAIIDSRADMYTYINTDKYYLDETKVKKTAHDYSTYSILDYGKDRYLPVSRPLFWVDDSGSTWIGFSLASDPTLHGIGGVPMGQRDYNNQLKPWGQATLRDFWRWFRYDPDKIKLQEFTDKDNAPYGPQPFVILEANISSPNSGLLAQSGREDDFNVRNMGVGSEFIVAPIISVMKKVRDNWLSEGTRFISQKELDDRMMLYHTRPYELNGSGREIQKTMDKTKKLRNYMLGRIGP